MSRNRRECAIEKRGVLNPFGLIRLGITEAHRFEIDVAVDVGVDVVQTECVPGFVQNCVRQRHGSAAGRTPVFVGHKRDVR